MRMSAKGGPGEDPNYTFKQLAELAIKEENNNFRQKPPYFFIKQTLIYKEISSYLLGIEVVLNECIEVSPSQNLSKIARWAKTR